MVRACGYEMDPNDQKLEWWAMILIGISYFLIFCAFPFSLCACVKIAQEYERFEPFSFFLFILFY
jgi:hypothetical protein